MTAGTRPTEPDNEKEDTLNGVSSVEDNEAINPLTAGTRPTDPDK